MKTNSVHKIFTLILLTFGLILFQSSRISEEITIDIQVSPHVINLSFQGTVVTVHTDISYWIVKATTVTLNGVEIDHWKSDDQGNFVAKFLVSDIKEKAGLVINSYNTLTLSGVTTKDDTFTGSEEIKVVEIIPNR